MYRKSHAILVQWVTRGLFPFSETIFKDFSRSQIYFSTIPNFTLNPLIPKISKSILLTVYRYFHHSYKVNSENFIAWVGQISRTFRNFLELSRICNFFQWLSSPGKWQTQITWLSRFSRTHTNLVTYGQAWLKRSLLVTAGITSPRHVSNLPKGGETRVL